MIPAMELSQRCQGCVVHLRLILTENRISCIVRVLLWKARPARSIVKKHVTQQIYISVLQVQVVTDCLQEQSFECDLQLTRTCR